MTNKPKKKNDKELYELIKIKISSGEYVFLKHAKQRQAERNISDLDVLDILEGKPKRQRKRNKGKDIYQEGQQDWNYCLEGVDLDNQPLRIIISFQDDLMPIITVIRV